MIVGILLFLFLLFTGALMYSLVVIAGQADDLEEEIWNKKEAD